MKTINRIKSCDKKKSEAKSLCGSKKKEKRKITQMRNISYHISIWTHIYNIKLEHKFIQLLITYNLNCYSITQSKTKGDGWNSAVYTFYPITIK